MNWDWHVIHSNLFDCNPYSAPLSLPPLIYISLCGVTTSYKSCYFTGDGLFMSQESGGWVWRKSDKIIQLPLLNSFLVPPLPHLGDKSSDLLSLESKAVLFLLQSQQPDLCRLFYHLLWRTQNAPTHCFLDASVLWLSDWHSFPCCCHLAYW